MMNRKALIVVDMLNDFIDEKGALYYGATALAIVPFLQQKLEEHRTRGDLVIFLKDSQDENDLEFDEFPKHCVTGTWDSQIIPALSPGLEDTVIAKKRYSGLYGTNLDTVLREDGVTDVVVVGACTSIRVMDTVGGLAKRDYRVSVPKAGVADFDAEFHEFALKRMQKLSGALIT